MAGAIAGTVIRRRRARGAPSRAGMIGRGGRNATPGFRRRSPRSPAPSRARVADDDERRIGGAGVPGADPYGRHLAMHGQSDDEIEVDGRRNASTSPGGSRLVAERRRVCSQDRVGQTCPGRLAALNWSFSKRSGRWTVVVSSRRGCNFKEPALGGTERVVLSSGTRVDGNRPVSTASRFDPIDLRRTVTALAAATSY